MEALIKIEGQPWTTEDWTRLPDREFCRSKPAERIEELVIIFSNSDRAEEARRALADLTTFPPFGMICRMTTYRILWYKWS